METTLASEDIVSTAKDGTMKNPLHLEGCGR